MLGLVDYGEEEEEEEEGVAMEQAQAPSSSTRRPLSPDPPTTPSAQQHGSKRPRLSGGVKRKAVRWAGPELLEDVFVFYKDRPIDPSAMVEENEDDEEASTSSTGPEATGGGAIGPASPSSFSSSIYTPRETVVTVVRRKKGQAVEGSGAGVTVIHPPHHVQDLIPHGRERLQQVGLGGGNEWGSSKANSSHSMTGRDGQALHDPAAFEFYCDHCNYTIERNHIRYECVECAGEFCLCGDCYDEQNDGDDMDTSISNGGSKRIGRRRHPHELRLSRLPFHATLLPPDTTTSA